MLARALRLAQRKVRVCTFYPGGAYESLLADYGVEISCLEKSGRWDVLSFLYRFVRVVRTSKADTAIGFLEGANILLVLTKPITRINNVVSRIAASYMDLKFYDWLSRLSFRSELWCAKFANLVIVNSELSLQRAEEAGIGKKKIAVLRNAIDTDYFRRSPAGATKFRSELGLNQTHFLVGMVGRFDPMKDHLVFIQAANEIAQTRRDVYFICVGGGRDENYRQSIVAAAKDLVAQNCMKFIGYRSDLPDIYSALDVNVLSSYGEGSPNTVAEAMACETPCVVTDVGDARHMVGDTGEVVACKNHDALANGITRLLQRRINDYELGARARQRICSMYSLKKMMEAVEQVIEQKVA